MARRYTSCAFVALLALPTTACLGSGPGAGSAEQYQGVLCEEDAPFCDEESSGDGSDERSLGGSSFDIPASEGEAPAARGLGRSAFGIPASDEEAESPDARGLGDSVGGFGVPAGGEEGQTPESRGLGSSVGGFDSFAEPSTGGASRGLGAQGNLSGGGNGGGGFAGGSQACDLRDVQTVDEETLGMLPDGVSLPDSTLGACIFGPAGSVPCAEQGGVALSACPSGAVARCTLTVQGFSSGYYIYPTEGLDSEEALDALAEICEGIADSEDIPSVGGIDAKFERL